MVKRNKNSSLWKAHILECEGPMGDALDPGQGGMFIGLFPLFI